MKLTWHQLAEVLAAIGAAALLGSAGGCAGMKFPTSPAASGKPAAPAGEGQLRVGDELRVRLDPSGNRGPGVSGSEDYVLTVDENGDISLPLVGRVPSAGMSPGALAERIEATYVPRYYVRCSVSVTIAARYFYVGGEVRSSGRFNWTDDMTLLKAINTAGAFTDYANRGRVEITRGKEKITMNCEELRRDPAKDIPIRPGDSIWVPRSIF